MLIRHSLNRLILSPGATLTSCTTEPRTLSSAGGAGGLLKLVWLARKKRGEGGSDDEEAGAGLGSSFTVSPRDSFREESDLDDRTPKLTGVPAATGVGDGSASCAQADVFSRSGHSVRREAERHLPAWSSA